MELDEKAILLLDRLYNLRSDDSVILVNMEEERKKASDLKEKTSLEKVELESKINSLIEEENILKNEGQNLERVLDSINANAFKKILERLNIDFDPEKIKKEVNLRLPETINKVLKEKEEAHEKLISTEEEMNNAIMRIEELGIRKDEAIYNQSRLNRIFELALSHNINITREEITSLLAKFDFSEEEQRIAAKILMFPEDGLFEYDKNPTKITVKSDNTSIAEPIIDFKEIKNIEPSQINVTSEEKDVKDSAEIKVELKISEKDELINLLKELGYNHLEITDAGFNELLENFDKDTISKNAKLIEQIGIDKELLNNNVQLFYDTELSEKLDVLSNIGKMPKDISLNCDVLIKYNLNDLNNAIKMLRENGLDPKLVPLMAY
ncbi:MAG: hypothetical protein GX951_03170 [Mollicutes bacterium]|nr:hypothetical protein [Mollicutes bacterium]